MRLKCEVPYQYCSDFQTALLFSAVRFVIIAIDCVTHFGASLLLSRHHPNWIKCFIEVDIK